MGLSRYAINYVAIRLAIALVDKTYIKEYLVKKALSAMLLMPLILPGIAWSQCTAQWYRDIDTILPSQDAQGHGPDLGSAEWKSVIEGKLKKLKAINFPEASSKAWCKKVDSLLPRPSFSCKTVAKNSIAAKVCQEPELALLDAKLAYTYALAAKAAQPSKLGQLHAEQRGWIKGRDECWKSSQQNACIHDAYQQRIATLAATYSLVPHSEPYQFVCGDKNPRPLEVVFYETQPSTLVANFAGDKSLMFQQRMGSGIYYRGRNEWFKEHQHHTTIQWGYQKPVLTCKQHQSTE